MKYFFVESAEFTRKVVKLGLESELADLQAVLLENPRAGVLEVGTCGLRKIRVSDSARWQGKRFGARIHYAFVPLEQAIYFLSAYRKNEHEALTAEEKRRLCKILRTWGAE
jgi:hypothetical protein